MITGMEIDFVVKDCIGALELYRRIFDVEVIEDTDLESGTNEAVFSIYGVRFHMLDENPQYGLTAPEEGRLNTVWFNAAVPDIRRTWDTAMDNGCSVIQEITELHDFGVINAVFKDPFGYVWMLHEIRETISFEDRMKAFEKMEEESVGIKDYKNKE